MFEVLREGSFEFLEYNEEHNKPYLWVCVTGIDGCGKTTSSEFLNSRLAPKAKRWKSPHFDWVREMMRLFGDDVQGRDVYSDALTFATEHRAEQYMLRKWWNGTATEEGACALVSQRGVIDFFTFLETEGMAYGDCADLLRPESLYSHPPYENKFLAPHVIIYLDCDTETALSRIRKGDKWETPEFLKRLEGAYPRFFIEPPEFFENSRVYKIDGRLSVRDVQENLDAVVSNIHSKIKEVRSDYAP